MATAANAKLRKVSFLLNSECLQHVFKNEDEKKDLKNKLCVAVVQAVNKVKLGCNPAPTTPRCQWRPT